MSYDKTMWLRCNLVRNWASVARFSNATSCETHLFRLLTSTSSIAIEILPYNHWQTIPFSQFPHRVYTDCVGHPLYALRSMKRSRVRCVCAENNFHTFDGCFFISLSLPHFLYLSLSIPFGFIFLSILFGWVCVCVCHYIPFNSTISISYPR